MRKLRIHPFCATGTWCAPRMVVAPTRPHAILFLVRRASLHSAWLWGPAPNPVPPDISLVCAHAFAFSVRWSIPCDPAPNRPVVARAYRLYSGGCVMFSPPHRGAPGTYRFDLNPTPNHTPES